MFCSDIFRYFISERMMIDNIWRQADHSLVCFNIPKTMNAGESVDNHTSKDILVLFKIMSNLLRFVICEVLFNNGSILKICNVFA
jgi:hypothetical protein